MHNILTRTVPLVYRSFVSTWTVTDTPFCVYDPCVSSQFVFFPPPVPVNSYASYRR